MKESNGKIIDEIISLVLGLNNLVKGVYLGRILSDSYECDKDSGIVTNVNGVVVDDKKISEDIRESFNVVAVDELLIHWKELKELSLIPEDLINAWLYLDTIENGVYKVSPWTRKERFSLEVTPDNPIDFKFNGSSSLVGYLSDSSMRFSIKLI
jgi:hypothetical protein